MGTSGAEQLNQFYLFCGLGFFLGAFYILFRVMRVALEYKKRLTFVTDIIFFVVSAFVTFLFSLSVSDGKVRGYFLLGLAAGFFAFYFTIGKLIMKVAKRIIKTVIFIWNLIWKIILAPFKLVKKLSIILFNKALKPIFLRIGRFFHHKWNKITLFAKKGLQHKRKVVYNQSDSQE